jgi:hypothetical protein
VFPVLVVFLVCSAWAVSTDRAFIRILSVSTDFGHYTPEIGRFLHTECISTATLVTVAFSSETVVEARAPGARLSRRVISFSWPDFQTFSHSLKTVRPENQNADPRAQEAFKEGVKKSATIWTEDTQS